LSPKVIKEVGKIAFITGIGQILFTTFFGFLISIALGFNWVTALYISIALTFSSTIIIMKLLSDKDALEKLYGKISIGFLLIQDVVAIIILIVVSSLSSGLSAGSLIVSTLVKGVFLIILLALLSYYALPKLSHFFAKSQEFLFLFAIAWGLGLSSLFFSFGFSIEAGALIAGIMLSMSPYSYEISSKLKPLRDFFVISFFLLLGSQMVFSDISNLIFPVVLFSLFVLIGKPLVIMILMGFFGYGKKTGFMTGLTSAQISEFSLILIALAVRIGNIPVEIMSFLTLIGLITIAGSTYMIIFSERIYSKIERYLSVFERRELKEKEFVEKEFEYILLGENRIGFSIMKSFIKMKKNYGIIEFNPERVKYLRRKGINCIYGDVSNVELIEELKLDKAKMIVSTIPEKDVSLMLLNKVKGKNKEIIVIVTAKSVSETFELYNAGADYVILPHYLGGEYVAGLLKEAGVDKKMYASVKEKQLRDLRERMRK